MKKLKIAQIAPIILNIPPKTRGGTEKIVYDLTENLIDKGHDVTLFATKSAKTSAKLKYSFEKGLVSYNQKNWAKQTMTYLNFNHFINSIAQIKNEFDVIHIHFNQTAMPIYKYTKIPCLITYHFPINKIVHQELSKDKNYNPVAISNSHKNNNKKIKGVVYNGLNLNEVKFNPKNQDYWVIAGRITPDKGIHQAIQICNKLNKKLYIIGKVYTNMKKSVEYFNKKIKPYLGKNVNFLGEMSHSKLLKTFSKAECFIFPIQWEEPFGLVMIEAMATGTPVIAFNRGAVPEVVKNGKTGFVVKDINQAIKAGRAISEINRHDCRKWVERKFSINKMTDDYLKLYYKIIKK